MVKELSVETLCGTIAMRTNPVTHMKHQKAARIASVFNKAQKLFKVHIGRANGEHVKAVAHDIGKVAKLIPIQATGQRELYFSSGETEE